MYLHGKNSVRERLLYQPDTIRQIWMRDNFDDASIIPLLYAHKVAFKKCSDKDVGRYVPGKKHQGIVAEVADFTYALLDDVVNDPQQPTLMFLDKVQDPQNLGGIMRTLACFGGIVLCISKHKSCSVNETVLHVAAGADNYLQVVQVSNTINALVKVKQAGYWTVGMVVDEGKPLDRDSLVFPLAVVLGSEGEGIGPSVQKYLDFSVTIPMYGADLSFNVSIAAAILAYECVQQKKG